MDQPLTLSLPCLPHVLSLENDKQKSKICKPVIFSSILARERICIRMQSTESIFVTGADRRTCFLSHFFSPEIVQAVVVKGLSQSGWEHENSFLSFCFVLGWGCGVGIEICLKRNKTQGKYMVQIKNVCVCVCWGWGCLKKKKKRPHYGTNADLGTHVFSFFRVSTFLCSTWFSCVHIFTRRSSPST